MPPAEKAHDAHALGVDMPLVGIRAHRGDHLGKICRGVRKLTSPVPLVT